MKDERLTFNISFLGVMFGVKVTDENKLKNYCQRLFFTDGFSLRVCVVSKILSAKDMQCPSYRLFFDLKFAHSHTWKSLTEKLS